MDIRALLHCIPHARRRQLWGLVGLTVAGGAAELLSIGAIVPFMALLAGRSRSPSPSALMQLSGINALPAATAAFVVAVIAAAALRLLLQSATQRVVLGVGHELTVEIQRRTLLQPYAYHVRQHSSALIASLEKVQDMMFGVLLPLVQAGAALVISLFIVAALARIEPTETALAGVVLAAAYFATAAVARHRLAHASTDIGRAYAERVRLVQDSVGAIRDVIIDSSQASYLAAFREADARFAAARARISVAGAAPRFVIEAIGMILIATVALFLARRSGGLASALPALAALALGAQRLLPLLQQLHQAWTSIAGNRATLRDVVELISLPVPFENAPDTTAPLPFRRSIELCGVSFTYEGSPRPALDDVALTIPAGTMVALVGPTGWGKSTLADLVMALLRPTAGEIKVDGVAISQDNKRAWQRNIAHVPQSIFLTDTSIARNIAQGEPADPARLDKAVRDAQLSEFVASLPDGLGAEIGECGIRLSGGQRQRLGLARALYKGASFLIIDEGTNALDSTTEAGVLSILADLRRKGRTILIISHRSSTIAGCDRIFRLEDGRLIDAQHKP
ncbi:MAG: ABC transporter ATP-binding protein/permease [Sphingomonadales bacterium]|nr:ABC transporter ATP-binding protein/permease [Sphingomonadales bacterium]